MKIHALASPGTRRTLGALAIGLAAGLAIGLGTPAAVAQPSRTVEQIGSSREGRPIEVITLGAPENDAYRRALDVRPAIAVIAGLDGRHTAGPEIARRLADRLIREHGDVLADRTVYIIPVVNPDGQGSLSGRNVHAFDADRDGRVAEDGAEDLNGDGLITMMRVRRPSPATGLEASVVPQPSEPRLHRAPDASENEAAEYAVLREGLDDDGDGRYNEDGPDGDAGGGVVLNHNFTAFWPEHDEAAGMYPLSEPESKAVADWLLGRDNVQAVFVIDPADTLLNTPPTGRYDQTGRMPVGLESGDERWHKAIAEAFTEATEQKKGAGGDHRGSLRTWAYAELGLWSFSHPGWTRPAPEKADASEGDSADAENPQSEAEAAPAPDIGAALRERGVPAEMVMFFTASPEERMAMIAEFRGSTPEEQAARMAQIQALPDDLRGRVMAIAQGMADPGAPAPGAGAERASDDAEEPGDDAWAKTEDGKWLAYSTEERGAAGFIDWTPFEHPQLGPVEIGGFVPGFRVNPPDDAIPGIAGAGAGFVAELAGMLADVRVARSEAERVGPGLWRVRVTIGNTGTLPTASAMARKARRLPPELLVMEAPPEVILSGPRVQRFESIPGGDEATAEWMITARDGSSVDVTLRSARYGDRIERVRLVEAE